jgi:iron complex transport system permease protein
VAAAAHRAVARAAPDGAGLLVLGSAAVLVFVVVGAAMLGSVPLAPSEVIAAIGRAVGRGLGLVVAPADLAETIVVQIRLPRVLSAATVGAALALAGAAFQGVFRNPLADPYLLGAASGAGLAAAMVLVLGTAGAWWASAGVGAAAFVGAIGTVVLVVALARQGTRVPVVSLVLAGVVVGSSLSAGTSFVLLAAREQAAGVLAWLLGSFAFASWAQLAWAVPALAVAGAVVLAAARGLDVLQLGDAAAAQLGLAVEPFKVAVVAASTLATAAAVATAGVIGFVGLVVPHAVRLVVGPGHRRLLPLSALWGAAFVVAADLLARTVIAPAEVPVGVVTALAGAPFFVVLLRRHAARGAP